MTVTSTLYRLHIITGFAMSVLTVLSRSSVRRALSPFLVRGYAAKDQSTERKSGINAKDVSASAAEGECAKFKNQVIHVDIRLRKDAFFVSPRYSPRRVELPQGTASCHSTA